MDLTDYIKVPKVEKVFLYENYQPRLEGTLVMSSYHFIFSEQPKQLTDNQTGSPVHQQPDNEIVVSLS